MGGEGSGPPKLTVSTAMQTVSFYAYASAEDGGIGRSRLLVNTARFLALTGRKVVALDLDLEAPSLHERFELTAPVERGVVDLLADSLGGELPDRNRLHAASVEVRLTRTHGGWLRLLAAGLAPSPSYWASLARLRERLDPAEELGLLEGVIDLQAKIEEVFAPDVLLIDARAGTSSLAGTATLALSDRVILVSSIAPGVLEGTRAIADSLAEMPALRGGRRALEFLVCLPLHVSFYHVKPSIAERLGVDFEVLEAEDSSQVQRPPALDWAGLDWIRRRFCGDELLERQVAERVEMIAYFWDRLVRPRNYDNHYMGPGWRRDQIKLDVRFGAGSDTRVADLAVIDEGDVLLVWEYKLDDAGLEWWRTHVKPPVIVAGSGSPRSRSAVHVEGVEDTWLPLPLPDDFELLDPPGARTLTAMLMAARTSDHYDQWIVNEWCGVRDYEQREDRKHARSRQIADGLAAIDDPNRIFEFLCHAVEPPRRDRIPRRTEHLIDELCATAFWRAPPGRIWGRPDPRPMRWEIPDIIALRALARAMGLTYGPQRLLGRVGASGDHWSIDGKWQHEPLEPAENTDPFAHHGHFGRYHPDTRHIVLAAATIEAAATRLGQRPRHIGAVVRLHFAVLALMHVGLDLDGEHWPEFAPEFEPTAQSAAAVETLALAQLFVHRFIRSLADPHLEHAFAVLSDAQAPPLWAWRKMEAVSLEAARAWLMRLRKHGPGAPPIDLSWALPSEST